jgi:hypothetical protein
MPAEAMLLLQMSWVLTRRYHYPPSEVIWPQVSNVEQDLAIAAKMLTLAGYVPATRRRPSGGAKA